MLASTVQFSRYGRRLILIFRVHQLVPFERNECRTKFDHYGLEGRAQKARSLRTQQCAYGSRRTKDHVPPDKSEY